MRKWFTGIRGVFTTIVITLVIFFTAVAIGNEFLLEAIINLMLALVCFSPFALVGIIAIRINSFMQNKQTGKKKKRDFMGDAHYNDIGMQDIMSKLSPQERAYLERQLADREVGFGDDGEIVSMEDLLSDFEEKSKRKK